MLKNLFKNLLPILSLAYLATSCSSSRPATRPIVPPTTSHTTNSSGTSLQFINNIAINPDAHQNSTGSSITTANLSNGSNTGHAGYASGDIENYAALQFKYAILENATVEEMDNAKLLSFMEYWYGTPYHYGGTSRDGIDCSAFAFLLVSSVYGVAALPRTSKEQYEATRRIGRDELQEGDLVFFHTLGKRRAVTHVGVYLRNNKFIHASISGVMISDMNEGYYDKHFVGAGRIADQVPASGKNTPSPIPSSGKSTAPTALIPVSAQTP